MKRLALLAAIFAIIIAASARTYTPADVPNVHVADRTRHLVNPDGIISLPVQAHIDSILAGIRTATSAEVAAVVVDDIDNPDDIDEFATELFTRWGLGKADRDNGVLILVARDMRKAVIRTGYGAEGVLPDIVCGHILEHDMFPAFREGDYDRGTLAAVQAVARFLTDPDAAAELQSQLADADRKSDEQAFHFVLCLFAVAAAAMLIILLLRLWMLRGRSRYEKYRALEKWRPYYLALGFLTMGMGLVAAIVLVAVLFHLRNGRRMCPNCGHAMQKIDEVHDNDYLSPSQDLEERIGSVDYDVWLCPQCGETDILPYVNAASSWRECERCHARTAHLTADRTVVKPTTTRPGKGEREYTCINCHHITRLPYKIEHTAPLVIIGAGMGAAAGRHSGSGGGTFGGGFGGGFTGGGGASGGW